MTRKAIGDKVRPTSVLVLAFSLALTGALTAGACAKRTSVARALQPQSPAQTDPFRQQVINAINLGEGDLELATLRDRISSSPDDLAARIAIARHYQSHGYPEIALEHLRLACERAPESVQAHLEMARVLRKQGRSAESGAVLERFAAAFPSSANGGIEVWAWLGLLRDESGDWKGGEQAYRRVLSLAPDRDDLHNNLGYCLLEQGRKEEAAAEFREALRLNRHSLIARDNLGIALASNSENSSANLREAVLNWQSVSDPASAHNNLAVVLLENGKYAEARREIDLALGYNQQHPAALNNLRLLTQLDGKPAEFQSMQIPSRPSRLRAAWRWLLATDVENDRAQTDSGKAVASR